jgi:hypothetical protein
MFSHMTLPDTNALENERSVDTSIQESIDSYILRQEVNSDESKSECPDESVRFLKLLISRGKARI